MSKSSEKCAAMPFATEDAALAHMANQSFSLQAYKCEKCGAWHLRGWVKGIADELAPTLKRLADK